MNTIIFKIKPMYFCLERQAAENFLCNNICSVPPHNKKRIIVFQTKTDAIKSMRRDAKKALKNNGLFRFVLFGFYFSGISPVWVDEQKYKGDYKDGTISSGGKVMLDDISKAENRISIKDFFLAESWRFYETKNKELKCEKDYRTVEVDEADVFAD